MTFNEIIIDTHSYEERIAVIENNKLVELIVEQKDKENLVGNIYKGKVKNVLQGMGAAFIDIGLKRTAFLHYKDIAPDYLVEVKEDKRKKKRNVNIKSLLKVGQEIIVQIKKAPILQKGARVIGKISIPGKFLVYIPNGNKIAFSKKISSATERKRIKDILSIAQKDKVSLIVRTEAEERSNSELLSEYNSLHKTWEIIKEQIKKAKTPSCIFMQNNVSNILIRDIYRGNINKVIVDNKQLKNEITSTLEFVDPELIKGIELYEESTPVFEAYGIEKEIEKIYLREVDLPSGGNIVIEQTEAMVVIDINTGSFTGNKNYEETVTSTNIEAAVEIARQIRLRNLSGIIIIDFIDMLNKENKAKVFSVLKEEMKKDRGKNKVYPYSSLGLVEISRKRNGVSVANICSEVCHTCNGMGRILTKETFAMKINRWLCKVKYLLKKGKDLTIEIHPSVKSFLDSRKEFFNNIDRKITLVENEYIARDKFKVYYTGTKENLHQILGK